MTIATARQIIVEKARTINGKPRRIAYRMAANDEHIFACDCEAIEGRWGRIQPYPPTARLFGSVEEAARFCL